MARGAPLTWSAHRPLPCCRPCCHRNARWRLRSQASSQRRPHRILFRTGQRPQRCPRIDSMHHKIQRKKPGLTAVRACGSRLGSQLFKLYLQSRSTAGVPGNKSQNSSMLSFVPGFATITSDSTTTGTTPSIVVAGKMSLVVQVTFFYVAWLIVSVLSVAGKICCNRKSSNSVPAVHLLQKGKFYAWRYHPTEPSSPFL